MMDDEYREAEDACNGDFWRDSCEVCGEELTAARDRERGRCLGCVEDEEDGE